MIEIDKDSPSLAFLAVGEFFCNWKLRSYYKKRSAGMHTAAYNVDVASDRRRRKNVQGTFFVLMLFVLNGVNVWLKGWII